MSILGAQIFILFYTILEQGFSFEELLRTVGRLVTLDFSILIVGLSCVGLLLESFLVSVDRLELLMGYVLYLVLAKVSFKNKSSTR